MATIPDGPFVPVDAGESLGRRELPRKNAWWLCYARRCWKARIWWIPFLGPLIAAWVGGGDITLLISLLPALLLAVAVVVAPAVSAAAGERLPGTAGVVAAPVVAAVTMCFVIGVGMVAGLVAPTALVEGLTALGVTVNGDYLRAAWLSLVVATLSAGFVFVLERPLCGAANVRADAAGQGVAERQQRGGRDRQAEPQSDRDDQGGGRSLGQAARALRPSRRAMSPSRVVRLPLGDPGGRLTRL